MDLGSQWSKIGYAGEDSPKYIFPSHLGRIDSDKFFISNQIIKKDLMEIENPFKNGLVENWDYLEKLIQYGYQLDKSNEHPVMFAEVPFTTKEQREKTTSLFFEKFDVPAFFLYKSSALSCFASGKTSALVIDSGYSTTCASCVHDGYSISTSIVKQHQAGDYMTDLVLNYIEKKAPLKPHWSFTKDKSGIKDLDISNISKSFLQYSKKIIAEDIKHSIFQINEQSLDEVKNQSVPTLSFELNTGKVVDIGSERMSIPETFFSPKGSDMKGIHILAHESVQKSDSDLRKDFYMNIVLSGGTCSFNGFQKRFEKELGQKSGLKVKTIPLPSFPASKQIVWIGGSILSSLGSFQQMWISKDEFKETGAFIVHKKCP